MKFTYYTIIGKNLGLLKGHIDNIKNYAGFNKLTCDKELIVIIYTNNTISQEVTNSLVEYCQNENIRYVIYEEKTNVFIENLYACWNLGYEVSDDGYVFRGGSDQVFSKDSFLVLYEEAEKLRNSGKNKFILQANTIENEIYINPDGTKRIHLSRHFTADLGNNFDNFNYSNFENFNKTINDGVDLKILTINDALNQWGKPKSLTTSLGEINRADGCSWLMTKKEWITYGPLPPIEKNITGDVIIHDKMQLDGYTQYIVKDCITYHFVRGESLNQY
jgi:hypothetical protein